MASAKPLDCSTVRKVSTSTASRSPWISVAELATHIRDSLPGGTSRFRPGRVAVNTLYLNEGVLLSGLAMTTPGIMGIMARETIFIISRRFMPNLAVGVADTGIDPALRSQAPGLYMTIVMPR